MPNVVIFGNNVTDENLIPENIKDGVTIFGVEGTYNGPVGNVYKGTISGVYVTGGRYSFSATFPVSITTIRGCTDSVGTATSTIFNDYILQISTSNDGHTSSSSITWNEDRTSFTTARSLDYSRPISYIATQY